ncbi:ABC transporter permease [Xanthocytophaga flava]|uniref:ABC transporter permease n=1 Tax=Xanthocytophaga flava TaxID=3048013 RepID=UPI0028D8A798|nr:ABC transporter permease [Xanthocytophaga flavus]MDJ1466592.1 ABC transporter permease [Xanthocytophaga flavus]
MATPHLPRPPHWATRLLHGFCADHLVEEMEGDLEELFHQRVQIMGEKQARIRYVLDVLSLIRLFVLKQKVTEYSLLPNSIMLRNYAMIAFRNLVRQKGYAFINIAGLAVGMTVAMLIGLWVYDELSFNQYHQNYNHIARVMNQVTDEQELHTGNSLQYPLAVELKNAYGDQFTHLLKASWTQSYILSHRDAKVSKIGIYIEDGAPEMLTLKMLRGTWTGLRDPHAIMLSESTAKALFGDKEPLNQLIKINASIDVKVTGVYEDVPQNTEFHEIQFFAPFDLWVSMNDWIEKRAVNDWNNHFLRVYAQIKPNTSFEKVSNTIKDTELNKIKNLEGLQEQVAHHPQIFLHPMSQWHLYGSFEKGLPEKGPIQMVWLVGIIGGFVLLLACINFMNLSTARSEKRAREVGIRKTLGSLREQLISQFLGESYLVVLFAFCLSLLLTQLSLPWFNLIANKDMHMLWANPWFWLTSVGFIGLTGLLAGSYPALYLSSFHPVKVLKGTLHIGRSASTPRRLLVVLQFTVSVTLIICTIVVYQQIQFAKNRPVGYDRKGLITMEMKSSDFYGKYDLLRTTLQKTGVVTEMSESMGKVTEVASGNGGFSWKGQTQNKDKDFGTLTVTPEHGKTVGWQFVAGRDFSRELASDSSGMVINEAAARYMGLKNPVGEPVSWTWSQSQKIKQYRILGVIKDMVMDSPYEPIKPTLFYIQGFNGSVSWINIRLNPRVSTSQALSKIEAVFKKLIPTAPFDYQFVDQDYAKKFAEEERIGKLASVFALLAIFISCLGLFGLASFVAEQRTKEIGIRKVLGATILNIWQLLSKDFVLLITLSFVISTPIAWYFLNNWLQTYEYRTHISWWIFAVTGAGALVITLLTVSFQSIKVALMNPVKSLRNE